MLKNHTAGTAAPAAEIFTAGTFAKEKQKLPGTAWIRIR